MSDESTFTTKTSDSTATTGMPQSRRAGAPISVSMDTSTGTMSVPVIGEAPRDRRAEILERHAARMNAARGGGVDGVEVDHNGVVIEPPPPTQPIPDPDPPADDGEEEVDPDDEVEADDGAEPDAEAEEQPAELDPAGAYELEQSRLELAAARREVEDARAGRRSGDFDAYFDSPLKHVRQSIAAALGVEATDRLVDQEMDALRNALTWSTFSDQDLPDSTKDQLSRDGLDRKIRLDAHRRQSERKAVESSKQDQVAGEIASSIFGRQTENGVSRFPDAARYAELLYRRPIGEILVDVLKGAYASGQIRDIERSDEELFTEASRLLNDHCHKVAKSKGLQTATLTPATVPTTPGATPRPNAAQTATSPAAPKKAPTAKPRTLPQAKAGAAPSRPSTPQAEASLPLDSESRKAAMFDRFRNGKYNSR